MKALELTIYRKVDRWVDWTCEMGGKTMVGQSRECGYETPHGVWEGDEFPEKRLTDAELLAEYFRALASGVMHEEACEFTAAEQYGAEAVVLHRFAALPHYDEATDAPTNDTTGTL